MHTFKDFAKDLLFEKDGNFSFGCLMAIVSPELSGSITDWTFDHVDTDELAPDGRETEPHVTVLYGFHPDVTAEEVFNVLKDFLQNKDGIVVKLTKISRFQQEDQDILKIDVESQDLHDLNALLCEKFSDRYTNKYPEYHPHLTLAYIKKGSCNDIDINTFDGEGLMFRIFTYSPPDGENKQTYTIPE